MFVVGRWFTPFLVVLCLLGAPASAEEGSQSFARRWRGTCIAFVAGALLASTAWESVYHPGRDAWNQYWEARAQERREADARSQAEKQQKIDEALAQLTTLRGDIHARTVYYDSRITELRRQKAPLDAKDWSKRGEADTAKLKALDEEISALSTENTRNEIGELNKKIEAKKAELAKKPGDETLIGELTRMTFQRRDLERKIFSALFESKEEAATWIVAREP